MLLTEAGVEHLAAIVLLPKLTELAMSGWSALRWKLSSHLKSGDSVTVGGEEAVIMSVNFSGLHISYTKDGSSRTISTNKLDNLDVRKIK